MLGDTERTTKHTQSKQEYISRGVYNDWNNKNSQLESSGVHSKSTIKAPHSNSVLKVLSLTSPPK